MRFVAQTLANLPLESVLPAWKGYRTTAVDVRQVDYASFPQLFRFQTRLLLPSLLSIIIRKVMSILNPRQFQSPARLEFEDGEPVSFQVEYDDKQKPRARALEV